MAWTANESINLLNVMEKWELQLKDTEMRGKPKSKWQWVAAQLFAPKDEADLCRLSKRCERRVSLLRNIYEAYCLLALGEQNPALTPPPPRKVDGELWKRMKSFFSAPKSLKDIKSPKMAVARVLVASVKNTLKESETEDEEGSGSEDERQSNEGSPKLQLHEDSFSSSSSSVGSNNLYHDSPVSSRSSYYEICSYDSYTQNSDGSGQTPGRRQNFRPLWRDIDSWTEGSLPKSPSSSYDATDSNGESDTKDIDDHVAHDQMLAVERALAISNLSPCSEPKTTSSQAKLKSLIDFDDLDDPVPPVLGSGVIPSAAVVAAETVLNTLSPLLTALKIPSATAAVAVTPAAAPPVLVEYSRSSPSNSKLSLGSNASGKSPSRKKGVKKESNSGVSLSSSSRKSREVLISNSQNLSHHLQRLPTIVGSTSVENPPNADEDADGDRAVLSDEERKKLVNEAEPLQSSQAKSSSIKERNESHDGETGSRKSSSPSSSSSSSSYFTPQLPVSGPDIPAGNHGGAKDDNVNVMVYIKLNNLKISEGGH